MTDTEIVDWLQENLTQLSQELDGPYLMTVVGATCEEVYSGDSLRGCVEFAREGYGAV